MSREFYLCSLVSARLPKFFNNTVGFRFVMVVALTTAVMANLRAEVLFFDDFEVPVLNAVFQPTLPNASLLGAMENVL